MIEAILFDMDGLLIDSEPYWDKARSLMAAEAGIKWNRDDHRAVMGVSTGEWVDYMIKRLRLTMTPHDVEAHIVKQMVKLYSEQIPFLPGAVDSVTIAARHYPTGLASGSPRSLIDTVTNDTLLKGKFQVILSGDQVSHGKPSPDIYLKTAEEMRVTPGNCVCLEDSGNGILAGKNAGMKVICVPDSRFMPEPEKLEKADLILKSLLDFSVNTISLLD